MGKTTVVNQFGKQFDNYLYFNMEMAENVRMFEMRPCSFYEFLGATGKHNLLALLR